MRKQYDFIVVGAGLFGCVCADLLTKRGRSVLVVEQNDFIGGTCFTKVQDEIVVHEFGAHIFRTNNEGVWKYVNSFAIFNNFVNSPLAIYKNEVFNLPFNMNTFSRLWGVVTPDQAKEKILHEINQAGIKRVTNLEEWAISQVGTTIYHKLIEGYTEKQWGKKCSELPPEIMKRIPIRFTYDNNYYDCRYQGIPIGGYTPIFKKMLEKSDLLLNTEFLSKKGELSKKGKYIIFTGPIDAYFDYCFGNLEYRGLRFETQEYSKENMQGNAVVNYTERIVPYTRIIEHKHFEFGKQNHTIITKEFPTKWERGDYPFYPINNVENNQKYLKYSKLAAVENNISFGGRLGNYQYLDMQDTILCAQKLIENLLSNQKAKI